MPPRRHPHPEDARTHLQNAALRVFAQRGYEGASVRDIAQEAQVAPGLIYHYFASKQAILVSLFERSGALVQEAFLRAASVPEPRARLGALIQVSAQLVRENEDFWRVSYGVRFQHAVLDGLAVGIAAQSAGFLALFTALLTEIGRPDPATEARLLFAAMDGLFQHYILDPSGYPLDAVARQLTLQHGGIPAEEPV